VRLKPISAQSIVVFGASSGIGRETALQFARRGARLTISARDADGLRSLAEEVESFGGEALPIAAEVTDFSQVKAVADAAAERFGGLDTWVHLAGVSIYAAFEQITPEEFRRVIDVNLTGQAFGAMAALPHLKRAGGGALIHVSSGEARRAFPLQTAYAASKHGVKGLLDSLRVELDGNGIPISVTNVMPAGINTPFFDKVRTKIGVKPMPARPIYDPQVVAELILYAAEHPVRELYAGGAAKLLSIADSLAPRTTEFVLSKFGSEAQKTNEPKEQAKDNLFQPVAGYDRTRGDFGKISHRRSAYNWVETHPASKLMVLGGLLGAGFLALGWHRSRPGGSR
jgi:NAD(P)-dependent dehydrogenase (short-subunit alcohol dehydrogenase family)